MIGSFACYLLPIITPHVTVVWGVALWAEMTGAAAARPMAWLAADLGLALVVQMAAGGIIYWVARRPTMVRGLTLLATVPLFYFGLTVGTLIAIDIFPDRGRKAGRPWRLGAGRIGWRRYHEQLAPGKPGTLVWRWFPNHFQPIGVVTTYSH